MTDKIEKLTNEEMETITGGEFVGYPPTKTCPSCNGKLEAREAWWSNIRDEKLHETVCQKCGATWPFRWQN